MQLLCLWGPWAPWVSACDLPATRRRVQWLMLTPRRARCRQSTPNKARPRAAADTGRAGASSPAGRASPPRGLRCQNKTLPMIPRLISTERVIRKVAARLGCWPSERSRVPSCCGVRSPISSNMVDAQGPLCLKKQKGSYPALMKFLFPRVSR